MAVAAVDGLRRLSDDVLRRFRERVEAVGYRPELLAAAESVAPGQLDAVSLPLVRWELARRRDAAGRLGLLLSYGDAVDADEVAADLGADLVVAFTDAGLLLKTSGTSGGTSGALVCPFRLVPLEGLLVLGDDPSAGKDAVMGPGPTTLELASQLPRACRGPALDVGAGAGTLALLLAARGAGPVVGTDVNPRATEVATFNARLNGLSVEFRTGDLDGPVAGTRFAWVISQPAYVLQPDGTAAVTFLHGGRRGDELAFRLLGRIPALLAPGGTALLLFDTPVDPLAPLPGRIRATLGDAPIDVVVLAAPALGAGAQAVGYAALEVPELGPRYAEAVQRYRGHLAQLGLSEWSHALVTLRTDPRFPAGGRYTVQLPVKTLSHGGPEALEMLLASLELATLPDSELLQAGVRFQQYGRLVEEQARPGAEPVRRVAIHRGAFGTDRALTDAGLALLVALEEVPDVARAVARYAELCGTEPAQVRDTVLGFVREGLGRGLLVPRERGSGHGRDYPGAPREA
jgi:SAM-dependent methyltransferase